MPKANEQANQQTGRNPHPIEAGVAGVRVAWTAAGNAGRLLAMRMRQHAEQADAAAAIL